MKSNTTWKHTSPAARLSLLLAPKSLPSPMIPMICYRAWMMRWRRCWLSFAQIIQQLWPDRKWSLSIGNVSIKVLAQPSTPWRVGRSFTPRHHHWRCGSHMGSYASAESLKLWCLSHWSQVTTLRTDHLAVISHVKLTDSLGAQVHSSSANSSRFTVPFQWQWSCFLPHNRTKVWDVRPAVPARALAPSFYVYEYGDYEIEGQKDTRPRRLMLWTGSEHFRALAFVENAGSHGTSRAQAQAI